MDSDSRREIAANLRFFGELRFKQLTLWMGVLGIAAAGIARNANEPLVGWVTFGTAIAGLVMLFTAVTWIMEVRSTMHWAAQREAASDVWPRHQSQRFYWMNSTFAVAVLFAVVYVFTWNCAANWGMPSLLLILFAALGVLLVALTLAEYRHLWHRQRDEGRSYTVTLRGARTNRPHGGT